MIPESLSVEVDVIAESALPEDAEPDGLAKLVRRVLEREGQTGDWSVAVVLTSDASLRSLHRDFMGIDAETDVMTFPADGGPGGPAHGGDIVVSVDRAMEQAPEFGSSPWGEIRFLVVHGALHLCGWDDTSEVDRAAMLERQRELIAEYEQGD
jgi:probable rRNA maturation factor